MQIKIVESPRIVPKTAPLDFVYTDVEGGRFQIAVRFHANSGRAVPYELLVTSLDPAVELTQAVLRRLPFRQFALGTRDPLKIPQKAEILHKRRRMIAQRNEPGSRGRNRLTEEEINETIAAFYEAYQTGQPIVKRVSRSLGIPISTANKRIMKLRKEGLLPPSRQRRVK